MLDLTTLAAIALAVASVYFYVIYRTTIKRRLAQVDYRLCIICEYDLSGHVGDAVRCPECGTEQQVAATQAAWKQFFGPKTWY